MNSDVLNPSTPILIYGTHTLRRYVPLNDVDASFNCPTQRVCSEFLYSEFPDPKKRFVARTEQFKHEETLASIVYVLLRSAPAKTPNVPTSQFIRVGVSQNTIRNILSGRLTRLDTTHINGILGHRDSYIDVHTQTRTIYIVKISSEKSNYRLRTTTSWNGQSGVDENCYIMIQTKTQRSESVWMN